MIVVPPTDAPLLPYRENTGKIFRKNLIILMNLPAASYRELQVKINKKPAISNGFLDFIGLSCDEGDSIEQLSIINHYISF